MRNKNFLSQLQIERQVHNKSELDENLLIHLQNELKERDQSLFVLRSRISELQKDLSEKEYQINATKSHVAKEQKTARLKIDSLEEQIKSSQKYIESLEIQRNQFLQTQNSIKSKPYQ